MLWTFAVATILYYIPPILSEEACDYDLRNILHDENNDLVSHGFFRSKLSSTIPYAYNKRKPTADNYESRFDTNYLSKYASIRSSDKIDMKYHNFYTADRIKLQDQIIDLLLDNKCGGRAINGGGRWITFMGGAPGVGKTYLRNAIQSVCRECLPEAHHENAIIISADVIRPLLPEYGLYDAEIKSEKQQQVELLGKEVGLICELLLWAALDDDQISKHILFDSSLRHTDWFKWLLETLGNEYPSYKTAIIGVLPESNEQLREQILKRNQESDRYTEWKFVKGIMADIDRSLFELKPLVDVAVNITNPGLPIRSVNVLRNFPVNVHRKKDGDDEQQLTLFEVARWSKGSLLTASRNGTKKAGQIFAMFGVMVAVFAVVAHLVTNSDPVVQTGGTPEARERSVSVRARSVSRSVSVQPQPRRSRRRGRGRERSVSVQ